MTFVLAILIFGMLIFVHELGHYLFARLFKVSIKEFSIGMGPKVFTKVSKKTGIAYSLRWLPIGGFVSMVGEDENSDDENALNKKPVWQRMIIIVAGGITNLITGAILMIVFVLSSSTIGGTVIAEFNENSVSSYYLEVGDEVVAVNGKKVNISASLVYEIAWNGSKAQNIEIDNNGEKVSLENVALFDITVIRDGEEMVINDVPFTAEISEGITLGRADFRVYAEEKSLSNIVKHSFGETKLAVQQVWQSLGGLLTGRFGIAQMSGPVGVTQQIGEVAKMSYTFLIYFAGLIAVNLGIFNLLPFPALDGGRFVFLLIEGIRKKPIPPEIEGKIHFAGIALLLMLMVVVTCKDIVKLFV